MTIISPEGVVEERDATNEDLVGLQVLRYRDTYAVIGVRQQMSEPSNAQASTLMGMHLRGTIYLIKYEEYDKLVPRELQPKSTPYGAPRK